MRLSPEKLADIVAELPVSDDRFEPRLYLCAGTGAPGIRMDRLSDAIVQRWLAEQIAYVAGGDLKLAAAYLVARLSYSLAHGLTGLALRGATVSALPGAAVRLHIRRVALETEAENGVFPVFDVWLCPHASRFDAPHDPEGFQTALETLLIPLVEAIHKSSNLPRAALWRLVGDEISAGFLTHGEALGCVDAAMSMALAILRRKGRPLFCKQTDFIHVALPEQPQVAQWFRARGGCCRYYTTKGGEYCTSCVLRDAQSQKTRLIDYLRRTHVACTA